MKKTLIFLISLLALTSFVSAKMVDGIALIVEGEAVTVAEIQAIQTQMGVNKSQAVDLLIQDRLQKIAMKDITIPEADIDKKIAQIAAQNNLSIPKMQKILQTQGTSWVQYRQSIRDGLKKSKFYQDVIASSTPDPTDDELKLFYKNHKQEFTLPERINMIEYSANSKKNMNTFLKTHKTSSVSSKPVHKNTKETDGALLAMLLATPNGGYTKSMNAGNRYVVYKIVSKQGKTTIPFEKAKNMVTQAWKQTQQAQSLKDYFQKLRTRADVQILR